MIIGVDFDNILFPTTEVVIDMYNLRHKTNIVMSNITTYRFHSCLDDSIADELISYFNEKTLYDNLWPIKASREVLKALISMGHEILIVTATDSKNLVWKEELVEKFFPFIPKKNVVKLHKKELLNVDVLIDDCLEHFINSSADKICFNYPWNQNVDESLIRDFHRVKSWDYIINIISEIERKKEKWKK